MNELNLWLLYAQLVVKESKNNNVNDSYHNFNVGKEKIKNSDDFKSTFIKEMLPYAQQISDKINAPVSALLAQGALESNWGRQLSGENNLFGIKNSKGKSVTTTEFIQGRMVKVKDNFANYTNISESWSHYGQWLAKHIGTQDKTIQQFMSAMSLSGYATDPNYTDKLFKTTKSIEKVLHNLL